MDEKKQLESVFDEPLETKKIQVTPKMGDSVLTAKFLSEASKKEKKEELNKEK